MDAHKEVLLRAIDAAMEGDIEALWIARLLLTSSLLVAATPIARESDFAFRPVARSARSSRRGIA